MPKLDDITIAVNKQVSFTKEISAVQFGIYSPEEILKNSIGEITVHKDETIGTPNTLYDMRMGPMNPSEICPTCEIPSNQCIGHFAHINLNIDIIHPLFYRHVLSLLRCFCIQCSKCLITKEHLVLWGISQKREIRFNKILEKIVKIQYCYSCKTLQPKIVFSSSENTYSTIYKIDGNIKKIKLLVTDIRRIFDRISDDDVRLLGFNPHYFTPKNLLISVLPVIPPRARPFIMAGKSICHDDLTISMIEIIKLNHYIAQEQTSEIKRQKHIKNLIFRIETTFNNSAGKAKHTNNRVLKGIKERISSKSGVIRNHLMGKRVNFSARSVIGPDVSLELNEIAIPHEIADVLVFPEYVNDINISILQKMIYDNQINTISRDGHRFHVKYALNAANKSILTLKVGDIVERKLRDGDRVVLNRQPSLHRGSMMAKKVKRCNGKSIRMSLGTTASFNADFDGDEMNLFPPMSYLSLSELEEIAATEHNMIGAQASKPTICIVQDALLSCFLMTKTNDEYTKEDFYQFVIDCDEIILNLKQKLKHIENIYKKFGKDIPLYSGKSLFSLLLPNTFNYIHKNKALEHEPFVKIHQGVLIEGALTKVQLGSNQSSLIKYLHKEYSNDVALKFVNHLQFVTNKFMLYHGFSVGIGDCLTTETEIIQNSIRKCFVEAEHVEQSTNHPFIKENRVSQALNKARDIGMRIAKESLSKNNNFLDHIISGSKGDFFNICQITGLLGQQNINGKRVEPILNNGKRTLPHMKFPTQKQTKDEEYHSRGFISHSFLHGLTPEEFWFHACSGREGVIDTATKTSQSGYTNRKMVKIMEDMIVQYDGTVRNSTGGIIQFMYGSDGFCGTQTLLKDDKPVICDVSRLVEQLNNKVELNLK